MDELAQLLVEVSAVGQASNGIKVSHAMDDAFRFLVRCAILGDPVSTNDYVVDDGRAACDVKFAQHPVLVIDG
ncbi:hypothetical protein D3C73_1512580 [compost metagenome]